MIQRVELNRIFWPLEDSEESDPDILRSMYGFGLNVLDWSELLECSRVVILAEAGTGKTYELRETARKLRAEGKTAFFCRIEDLATSGIDNAFVEGSSAEFQHWLGSGDSACFFLDSVDEARLSNPSFFEGALQALARALGRAAPRSHIFISARVSDWRATADLLLFREVLPPITVLDDNQEHAQGKDGDQQEIDEEESEGAVSEDKIQVVQLAPLTGQQRRWFAAAQGMPDVTAFMDAIERADADIFAERPQDLIEIISYWIEHASIGTHAEMIDFNIDKKLLEPNPDRDDVRPLSKTKAHEGAILIAAALTLTRKNSIILPDRPVDPGRAAQAIDAKDLLPTWDARNIQTLLGRALFDEATYGRVRFHHQSVREYLTAQWFLHLIKSGKPRRAVENLLFANRYGLDIVVPSMQPVAGWLALWDDRIRDRIMAVAPDVLINHGDPASLPIDIRSSLLKKFASLNKDRIDTGASFDINAVRRLADPKLANTILGLLDRYHGNGDVRQLLLRMIWQGEIAKCAGKALSYALDASMDVYTRSCAIRAVAAAGTRNQKRKLMDALLVDIPGSGAKILGEAIAEFYPEALTTEELFSIIDASEPPARHSTHVLGEALDQCVSSNMPAELQETLLAGLVEMLEREPHIDRLHCDVSKKYAWLLGYGAKLAECIILAKDYKPEQFSHAVLRTIELEVQGQHYQIGPHWPERKLINLVGEIPILRHVLFWRAVERERKKRVAEGQRLTDWWQLHFDVPIRQFSMDDFNIFLTDIRDRESLDDRLVALTVAFSIWRKEGGGRKGRERMWKAVKGKPELHEKLHELLHPEPMSDETRKIQRQQRDFERRYALRDQQEKQSQQAWIRRLQSNPDHLRLVNKENVDQVFGDLYLLNQEILRLEDSSSRWGADRWELLEPEFGREMAEAARDGLRAYWRLFEPPLRSESNSSDMPVGIAVGLTGLAIESRECPNWAQQLSEQETHLACRYALCELNGFPDWVAGLLATKPEAFDTIMQRELTWEFERPIDLPEVHYMLSALRYSDETICERYRPFVWQLLENTEPAHAQTLEHTLSILLKWDKLDSASFARLSQKRYEASEEDGRRLTWLVAWMYVQADGALDVLRVWVSDSDDSSEATHRMVSFCNALLNHREHRFVAVWHDFERIEILKVLIPLIYEYVRIDQDNVHEGAYRPNGRGNAETARGYLLNRICETPGRAAYNALVSLSRELPHERSRAWLAVLAHRRAAADAEQTAWRTSDVLSYAEAGEREPRSARDLFELVCDRLDDLKFDLEQGDASEASILQGVSKETDMRNWFANRLRDNTLHRYSVPPEEELADATRPDLRIHAPAVDAPVTIELKIADKWTGPELSERLHNQLVGQYLRDVRSKFGIYLLVWRGPEVKKHWEDQETGRRMSFTKLIAHLQTQAVEILANRHDLDGICVIGIDLTARGSRQVVTSVA